MLAMSELSKLWPVGGWILQLFVHLMRRLTGPTPPSESSSNATASNHGKTSTGVATSYDRSSANNIEAVGMPEYNPGFNSEQNTMLTPPTSLDVRERDTDSPRGSFPQADTQDQQFPYIPLGADQLLSDAIWAGNMDASFDMDFLLNSNAAPFFSNPFGGISMAEESYSGVLQGQGAFMSR